MRLSLLPVLLALAASSALADAWDDTLAAARGQTVHWHAWGGDERTNAFIAWVGEEALARHGVTVEQVKLADTAEAVNFAFGLSDCTRVQALQAAALEEVGASRTATSRCSQAGSGRARH